METERVKCTCRCHHDPGIKHIDPCCEDGYIEIPVLTDEMRERILTDTELCKKRHYMVMLRGSQGNDPVFPNYTIYGCRRCGTISVRAMKGSESIHIDFDITHPDVVEAINRNFNNQ